MAKTHFKLGSPIVESFFSAFCYLPSTSALSSVFYGVIGRFHSLTSRYLFGFLETTGDFVHFLIRPFYFNRETLCLLRFCCGWRVIRGRVFLSGGKNVSGPLFGALVSFFCFGGSCWYDGIRRKVTCMTGIKEKSLDTCLRRYDGLKKEKSLYTGFYRYGG